MDARPAGSTPAGLQVRRRLKALSSAGQQLRGARWRRVVSSGVSYKLRPDAAAAAAATTAAAAAARLMVLLQSLIMIGVCVYARPSILQPAWL